MSNRNEFVTKKDLEDSLGKFKEEIILEFRLFLERVKRVLSSNNISPKRENAPTGLASQVKELQDWRKQVLSKLQI